MDETIDDTLDDTNDSSTAPQEFTISSALVESHFSDIPCNERSVDNDSKSVNIAKNGDKYLLECRVCRCHKSIFFCSDCVRNGEFTDSKKRTRIPERFAEKKLKYFRLKGEQQIISDKMDSDLNALVTKEELECRIRLLEANVLSLRKTVSDARHALETSISDLKKNESKQKDCKERQKKLRAKVSDANEYLIHRQKGIIKGNENKDNYELLIKELVQQRVKQLTTYIFPINTREVMPETNDYRSILHSETSPLLETISISMPTINYTVIEPWICGNGDYSAFTLFGNNENPNYPNRDSSFRNARYRTCAALAYITQLIHIIAFYLDIRLPKRLFYSEFFITDLNETLFSHKVAKLNANILYLCLSQNIDSELLNPRQTVHNVVQLLNSNHGLGIRSGPIVLIPEFYNTIESSLLDDLCLIDETEDNGNDQNDENLIIEYDWVENNIPDLQLNSDAQQTSYASGVISTFTSMWRIATMANR